MSIASANDNTTDKQDQIILNKNNSFTDLNNEINGDLNKTEIKLTSDYSYHDNESGDGINITRSLIIDGQGHIIDGKLKSNILIINTTNVILKNIIFMNGDAGLMAGGAIYFCQNSSGNIINCTFINNEAWSGGAIMYDQNTTGSIIDSVFRDNEAGYGGAIYENPHTIIMIKNCIFENNSATISPVMGFGGAIVCGINCSGIVENSSFINNSATKQGGSVVVLQHSNMSINNSIFNNNSAPEGGAIYHMDHSNSTITNSIFVNNQASNRGGSIYYTWTQNSVFNTTFINNTANRGGAIYNYKGRQNIIDNCSFIGNSAQKGGRVYYRDEGKGIINNSVFKQNNAEIGGGIFYLSNETKGIVNNTQFIRNYAENASTMNEGKAYNCTIIKITPKITLNKQKYIYHDDDYLKIKITGFNNTPVTNATIHIEITGIYNSTLITNSNGEVNITTKNLIVGAYNIITSFDGDDNYENITQKQNININKIPTKIFAKNKKIKAKKKNKKYTVIIKNHKNQPIPNIKVTLKIKNKKYNANTNKKGKATFKLKKLNKKGKYKTTITCTGNAYYEKTIQKVKLTIK